jgi:hypothetical protein
MLAFARRRGAEIGLHHHNAGAYLLRYAQESSWREDNRRVSNGEQVSRIAALALKPGKSVDSPGSGSGISPSENAALTVCRRVLAVFGEDAGRIRDSKIYNDESD